MKDNKEIVKKLLGKEKMKKNNIGSDLKIKLTEQVKRMYIDPPDYIEAFNQESMAELKYKYKKIEPENLKTRKITKEELNRLPSYAKSVAKQIPYFFVFIFLFFPLLMLFIIIKAGDQLSSEQLIAAILVAILFTSIAIGRIIVAFKRVVKPESEIAEGTVTFFSEKYINGGPDSVGYKDYFVNVAFHDQESYINHIRCNEYDYEQLEIDSKVYVHKMGKRLIAYTVK